MIKLSFKETDFLPHSKKVDVYGNKVTVVTLEGRIKSKLPRIPNTEIVLYLASHPFVDQEHIFVLDGLHITACGKAKRADGDIDNPVLAERIAESRAKIKLYRFMTNLILRICKEIFKEMRGEDDIINFAYWKRDSLYGDYMKHKTLLHNEEDHLEKLLEQA